ncbi:hypothetical protein [Nitrospira sp. BLG_2]|uniref:hypothetical protein n=1 Tax=Nitrospira sp. BLG_2 TaxID=3397507 RepID=UPI003B9AF33A
MTNQERYSDYKWIKVKRYTMDESKAWEERYKALDDHHIKETSFLIEEVRSLAKQLDSVEEAEQKLKKKQERADAIRSFFVMWWGFGILVMFIAKAFMDEPTQHRYSGWLLAVSLLVGAVCSFILSRIQWKKKNHEKVT